MDKQVMTVGTKCSILVKCPICEEYTDLIGTTFVSGVLGEGSSGQINCLHCGNRIRYDMSISSVVESVDKNVKNEKNLR